LDRIFEGDLTINWRVEDGSRYNAVGIVKGKTE